MCASLLVSFDPVISRPLRPDGVLRAHGGQCVLQAGWNGDRAVTGFPSQLVSTKALLVVHRHMTTRICPPQVGQKATNGAGCARRVGL